MNAERDFIDVQIEAVKETIAALERSHGQLHQELQRALDHHQKEQAERVAIALAAIDRRLDGMNEFRASLEDVTSKAVTRDIFDIITNRVTIVENTYVKKEDYQNDSERLRERVIEDLQVRDSRIEELNREMQRERGQYLRADVYDEKHEALAKVVMDRAGSNADRITALERNSVRQEVVDSQEQETHRMRRTMTYAIIGGVVLTAINFIINIVQSTGGKLP